MGGFSSASAVRAYANVGLETDVNSAHPHRLIEMLFDGALLALARARQGMMAKDIAARGAATSKAIQIINEGLKASLIHNDGINGDELASNLHALYDYMGRRLLFATLKNDLGAINEVSRLLTELKDAWNAINPHKP
jgi:flagellar secretion chaperone FliS